jgi:methylmalonyl-CoA/ethylmalonyl-CoA epimerase
MERKKTGGIIDHITIIVRSIEKSKPYFEELLETEFMETGTFEDIGVKSAMTPRGIELIEPIQPDSAPAKFLEERGEGLFCVAFRVKDIGKAKARAEKMGIRIVGGITDDPRLPKGVKEIWLHPKDNFGVFTMFTQGNPYHP